MKAAAAATTRAARSIFLRVGDLRDVLRAGMGGSNGSSAGSASPKPVTRSRRMVRPPARLRPDAARVSRGPAPLQGHTRIGHRPRCTATGRPAIRDARSLWRSTSSSEEGFLYDSSIFPIHPDGTGFRFSSAPAYVVKRGAALVEAPASTVRLGSVQPSIGGGGLLPNPGLRVDALGDHAHLNEMEQSPAIFLPPPAGRLTRTARACAHRRSGVPALPISAHGGQMRALIKISVSRP